MQNTSPKNINAKELQHWLGKSSQKPFLIDVRENNEIESAPFPEKVLHLPLSKAEEWIPTLPSRLPQKQPLVILCHAGVRSFQFCSWLIEQGFEQEIWNLEGGIDSWSITVDPTVPRY